MLAGSTAGAGEGEIPNVVGQTTTGRMTLSEAEGDAEDDGTLTIVVDGSTVVVGGADTAVLVVAPPGGASIWTFLAPPGAALRWTASATTAITVRTEPPASTRWRRWRRRPARRRTSSRSCWRSGESPDIAGSKVQTGNGVPQGGPPAAGVGLD